MQERVSLFSRRYPEAKTTVYKLRKLYARHKIKKKVIRVDKAPKTASLMDIAIQAAELSTDVNLALERNTKIIQLDEFVITKKTWPTHAWSSPKENVTLNQCNAYTRTYAVILAISRERGVELVDIYKDSINKMKFKLFLERLRQLNLFNDVLLILDNLSVHKSAETRERMDELGFQYSFTPPYSPRYNGIEEVIGLGKRKVKEKRLDLIMHGQKEDLRKIIHESFTSIDAQPVAKCIARSLQLLALN